MTQVRWSELSTRVYERMVSVLISTLNPEAERIDGSGGDGGRDVQLRRPDRLDLWELKSHSGRVGQTQRQQISRSLKRAATHNPNSWTLVIPVDHTPTELAWFDKLRSKYPFPLHWKGLTWLDGQMAERPHLPRYFVYGGADEATSILLELRRDEAEFAEGLSHVVARVERWVDRLKTLDPFWDFQITRSADGRYGITPVPKYRGAENDRPIRITVEGKFPTTDEGTRALEAFQMAIEFGRPTTVAREHVEAITVDAPAGLAGVFQSDLEIRGTVDTSAKPGLILIAYAVDGSVLSSLPLSVSQTTRGSSGAELTATDASGGLTLRLRHTGPAAALHSNFHFKMPKDVLPGQVAPTIRLLAGLRKPNRFGLRAVGSDHDMAGGSDVEVQSPVEEWFAVVLEALARIQTKTQIYFPVPDTISPEEASNVIEADKLLSGGVVEMKWDRVAMTIVVPDNPAPLAAALVELDAARLQYAADRVEELFGYKIPIRGVAIELDSARVDNRAALETQLPLQPGVELQVVLVPAETDAGRLRTSEQDQTA